MTSMNLVSEFTKNVSVEDADGLLVEYTRNILEEKLRAYRQAGNAWHYKHHPAAPLRKEIERCWREHALEDVIVFAAILNGRHQLYPVERIKEIFEKGAPRGEILVVDGGNRERFIKIDCNGHTLVRHAPAWDAVYDGSTGLMWATETLQSLLEWDDANRACGELTLCGYSDWRLPTRSELQGLVDYERSQPAVDTTFFPDTKSGWYWSASPVAGGADYAWSVSFDYGSVCGRHHSGNGCVRAVRGPLLSPSARGTR